jgi:serine/threonine-protein kinase
LLEWLLDEQQRRWRHGERPRVEDFLDRQPELRRRPEAVLDLIAQEVVLRQQAGEAASLAEYQGRFPHLVEQLRDRFAASPDPGPTAMDDLLSPHSQEGQTIPNDPGGPPATHSLSSGGGREELAPFVAPVRCQVSEYAIPGYDILGELGRGGMGLVLHGHDPELGRDLAVKVLLEGRADDPAVVRRFIEEAQIGGQVQHPGIVPVHALGHAADGRPYFTMKLIKGRTLAALLKERADLVQDRPRFLSIFQQICQTLAYAHSNKVIHRDLKPANVMVGAFGEVQVMDWGLAKVLGAPEASRGRQPPEEAASALRTVRTEQTGASSEAGSVLGTPAYMAPEQARGEIDRLDERCDVFGLGAILCEILTGLPPYVATSGWQVYPKAVAADLTDAFARLEASGADLDLLRLARTCLAAQAEDRPRDAGVVAAAVTAYLASVQERLRTAEVERAAAQAAAAEARAKAAAERRARRLTLGLAAAVLGLIAVAAGASLWLQREAARQEAEQRRAVEASLVRAAELRQQARWDQALERLDEAHHRLGGAGPADLRRRVEQMRADVHLVRRLDAARFKLIRMQGEGQYDFASAEREFEGAFRDAGLGNALEESAVVARRIRRSALREQVVAGLDGWALVTGNRARRAWLLAVARQADPDRWRSRFRDPAVWGNRTALERLAREAEAKVKALPPELLVVLAGVLQAREGDPVPLLTAAQARHPGDFWLNLILANALMREKKSAEALGYSRAALALRPDAAMAHCELATALQVEGRLKEALAEFDRAIALDGRLALAYNNRGTLLFEQDRLDEAVAAYRRALVIHPRFAVAHAGLGAALLGQNKPREAEDACRRAIALDRRLALAYTNLGTTLVAQDKLGKGIANFRKAIALATRSKAGRGGAFLLDARPALAHANLGAALNRKGQVEEAITEYRRALKLDPRLALAHVNLTLRLLQQGRFTEARQALGRFRAQVPRDRPLPSQLSFPRKYCERLLALVPRFDAVARGQVRPASAAEGIDYATLCRFKKLYRTAARLLAEAFAGDPQLADDLQAGHRYNAACSAALAAAGQGEDAAKLDDKGRTRLRQQALDWLRADLALRRKQLESGKPADRAAVQQTLKHWQQDSDLAGLRDATALVRLTAQEQKACTQLWADVAALLQRAGGPK